MRKLTMPELGRVDPKSFAMQEKIPVVVVLDNVRSMHNIGSIFRSCDAFAVKEIVLVGITARPPHREIEKSALGATLTVAWQYMETPSQAVAYLIQQGYQIWSVEQLDASTSLHQFEPQPMSAYAFVFGNEVNGVTEAFVAASAGGIEIPQFGTKHSFNVAVCAGIVLWAFFNKMDHSAPASG